MTFKLIIALVNDDCSEVVQKAARKAGATGSTIINNARGEGSEPHKTFFGLNLTGQCDVMLFLVEAGCADAVLEAINKAAGFDETRGAGMAFQVDVEKVVGEKI